MTIINTNEINGLPITELINLSSPDGELVNEIFDELFEDRETADVTYMKIAYDWAKRSKAIRKAVGAIIVQNRQIISDGYNGMPKGLGDICDIVTKNPKTGNLELTTNPLTLHAEANCFNKLVGSPEYCRNATIYVTLSPCVPCACKIIGVMTPEGDRAIKRVVFHEKYRLEELQQVTALFEKVGIEVVQVNHPDLDIKKKELDASRNEVISKYFPNIESNNVKKQKLK